MRLKLKISSRMIKTRNEATLHPFNQKKPIIGLFCMIQSMFGYNKLEPTRSINSEWPWNG